MCVPVSIHPFISLLQASCPKSSADYALLSYLLQNLLFIQISIFYAYFVD